MLKMKVIKNNIKKLAFVIIIVTMTSRWFYVYNRNVYYDYYFENNRNFLILIKDYIVKNNLEGKIHLYEKWGKNPEYTQFEWKLWKCYINNTCNEIIELMKKCNISGIWYYKYENNNYIYWNEGYYFVINSIYPMYNFIENNVVFSKWYYRWKKELDMIKWDEFNRIIKIFDDDWGVINWCYGCGWWGWD